MPVAEHSVKTVYEELAGYPPLSKMAGEIAVSIDRALERGKVPWIRVGAVSYTSTIISLISLVSQRRLDAVELVDTFDVGDLTESILRKAVGAEVNMIARGMKYKALMEVLEGSSLDRVSRVWAPGEFSIIGDSITVWSNGVELPFRVEVSEDKVERIGVLDVSTWRMTEELDAISFLEGSEMGGNNPEADAEGREIFLPVTRGVRYPDSFDGVVVVAKTGIVPESVREMIQVIDVDIRPTYWKEAEVQRRLDAGWSVWLVSGRDDKRAWSVESGLKGVKRIEGRLSRGFEVPSLEVMVLSGQELWGDVQLAPYTSGSKRNVYGGLLLDELHPGDFVVHEDHGVGLYSGMEIIEKDGEPRQYLKLKYAEKDRLFVPVEQVKRLTKYVGVSHRSPKLTRLGGSEWRRVKKKVKKAVRELASELLRLYAVRELVNVEPVPESGIDLASFEKDFPFVETEDQIRAVEDVREDLNGTKPMDRVLVGDVGFGKTEVAMRAAYMTVRRGMQVAVLAPTTILVEQHFRVFSDRFKPHGFKVEVLSRFLTPAEAKDVVSRVKAGKVDIVIGTHRLLSNDVSFEDLGLVVIDEEQKFGVSQKEKLKGMRVESHVLSMSATPIPRTLNMALSGVRDISVIASPPEGRKSVENLVTKFDWDIVTDSVKKEVSRNGQIYYVHNRISTIYTVKEKMSELLPEVSVVVGHGQMSGRELSKVMREFHQGKHDVLLCTTIIENGLDMPNVNTLIVERAEMFGLSQLYQIRGRIGRGTRQAYAYFLYHGGMGGSFVKRKKKDEEMHGEGEDGAPAVGGPVGTGVLWEDARERLDAIEQLQDLGSGFALAQRDLEIRGAGSFLGREQHGIVSAVGFGLYCRLLDEMIAELKKKPPAENG